MEERLKKILTGITVVGGIGVLAALLVYAPDRKDRPDGNFAMPVSDTETEKSFPKAAIDTKHLKEVEFLSDEGRTHVPNDTRVTYKTSPPTSGFHHDRWLPPAVYEIAQTQPELLVHNLEHGNVVIYFDRQHLSKAQQDTLTDLPKKYAGQWDGVVVVEQKGITPPLVLTAWRVKLPLQEYDSEKVSAFLDAFRGRGPEHPIR